MTAARRFVFDGAETDLPTLAKQYTAYSPTWLAAAIREGCTCLADLRQREAERLARQRRVRIASAETTGFRGFRNGRGQ